MSASSICEVMKNHQNLHLQMEGALVVSFNF